MDDGVSRSVDPPLLFSLKYINNYLMDYQEI